MAITLFPDQTGDTTATLSEEPLAPPAQLPIPEAPQQEPASAAGSAVIATAPVLPHSNAPVGLDMIFGESPWVQQDREEAAKKNEDYRKGMDVVDQAVNAPDEFFKGEDMSFAPDHKMAQMMATNDLALSVLTGSTDIPKSGVARRLALQSASIQNFNGQEADTEEAFHGLLQKQTLQRTKAVGLSKALASDAERSAISNAGLSQELAGFDFKRFLAQHGDRANEVQADASDLYDLYTKTYADARARIAPFESQLASVSSAMKQGDSLRPAVEQAWSELPPEQRKPFMTSLSFFAHNLPIQQQTDFWANLSRSDHRNWDSSKLAAEKALLSGAESDALTASAQHASGRREPDIALMPSAYNTQTEGDTRAIAADVHKRRQQLDFASDVLDMRNSVYEPIHVDPDSFLPSTFQRAAYQGPHMIGTLAVASVPYAGPAAIFMMAKGNAYSDYRTKFMATMPEEEASAKADGLSNWEAVPETLLMVSGSKIMKGALPFLEPWAQGLINKSSTTTGRYLTRAAISSVEESVVVGGQGFVNPAVQSLASLTDPKIPGVKWGGKDGVFDAQWAQFPETFVSLVPLIAFGSAMGTAGDNARAEAFRTAPVEHLQALGFSEAQIAARADAVAKGVGATNAWADAAMKRLDPRTPTATAAAEKIRQDFETSQKATEALQDSGDLPVLTRDGATGQWVVHTEGSGADGEDALRAPNRVEAWKLAESHYQAVRDLEAEHIGYMQSSLEAADRAAELPGGGTRSYELNLGKVFTEAMAATNPQAAERYATQVRNREIRDGGDGGFAGIILGTTSDEIARGIKQDVVRLYDGASAPTVFHETVHALRRKALEAGRLTRADDISFVRAFDSVLQDRTAQGGIDPDTGKATRTSLRILPEGIKNGEITEAQLDEAVSEIIESEVLKNRKGGKDRQDSKEGALQLPSGFLTRNLTSIARLAPGAAKKFTAFLNAVRARWGLTLGRALAMKKAEREGRFDSEARDNYLNKLLGLDAQAEHEKEADRITRQIIDSGEEPGAPPRSPADDADPFSIGGRGAHPVLNEDKPDFYSKLESVVSEKLPKSASPEQVLATIDPARGSGVKPEEIKWSGVEDAVQRIATENGGKVPKEALLDHLKSEGAVKFEEAVSRTDKSKLGDLEHQMEATRNTENQMRFAAFDALEAGGASQVQRMNIVDNVGRFAKGDELQRAKEAALHFAPDFDWDGLRKAAETANGAEKAFRSEQGSSPKYDQYTLPGGEHYREVVLTMPDQSDPVGLSDFRKGLEKKYGMGFRNEMTQAEADQESAIQAKASANYKSPHFAAENYVAHMRLDERPDSAGRAGLFIEEIQSDRHQAGREKGYGPVEQDAPVKLTHFDETEHQFVARFSDGGWSAVGKGVVGSEASEAELRDYFKNALERRQPEKKPDGVPDAPFRKDWPLQMFKRALRDAVASGKEWLGWTKGDTQAERFDLSKQVEKISAWRMDDERGLYDVNVTLKTGKMQKFSDYPEAKLPDILGKELAQKIVSDEAVGTEGVHLSGLDLKIGGEGMKGFYDQILPSEIGKYVKKWGAKVEEGTVKTTRTGETYFEVRESGTVFGSFKTREEADAMAKDRGLGSRVIELTGKVPIWKVDITPEMAASVKEGQTVFSISHNKMVGSVMSEAAVRIKEPKARIAFFSRMAKKVGELLREKDEIGRAFGKDYVKKAIVDPATAARIKKEAGIWQAFRRDELENEAQAKHMGVLSSDDLVKLKSQPVYAELSTENSLRGRLRSPGKADKRMREMGQTEMFNGGDYDGSEGISRSVFGGDLAPDQAAGELYDRGLINEPTTDAMWQALKKESESVESMKRFRQEADADLRQARVLAKTEADQRVKEALAEQKQHYSTKARLIRAIALLDGIKGALPPEIQARLGGYAQLAKLGSDKAMLDYLTKTIAKASDEVTGWLKREQRADLDKLVEKSRPNKNAPGEAKRGKVGAEAHRMFSWVEKYQDLDQRQVDAERVALAEEQKRIEEETAAGIVHPEALDLANRMRVLDAVGNFDEKSVEGQAAGLTWLHEVYTYGRDEWQATEATRLAGYAKMQRDTLDALAAQIGTTLPKLELPEFDRAKLEGKSDEEAEALLRTHETRVKNAMAVHKDALRTALDVAGLGSLAERQAKAAEALSKPARTAMEGGSGELISFVQALERILPPGHPLVERWNEAVGDAQDQKTDSVLAADKAWNEAAATAIGSKKMIEVKTRLGEMSLKQTISFLKQAGGRLVKIEVPLGDAEGLLDGSIHPGDYSLREEDLPALRDALDAHNARPDDGKGAAGKKAVKFLTVERSSAAEGIPTKLTEMQAMTLLLVSRQERYRSNLEKHGFTAFEIENVRAQLSPEAKEMMSFLADYYRDNYEPLAKVFREMFGVDLPPESNYSPGRFERGGADNARGPDDALQEGGFRANFTKTRAPSHDLAPALHNAAAVFQGHVAESEHWRAYAPLVRELKAVLQNLDVAHAIEAIHGEKNLSVINGWIQAFEQNGLKSRQKFDGMNSMWRGLQRNVAVMGLAFRMSSLIKNALLPALGTARRIGNRNWALGLLRFTAGKVDYSRFLHSDLIQRREAYGFSPEARAAAITLASEMPSRPKDAVEWSIRLLGVADARSTALGAAIAWDYHYRENLAQNMSHEEADALASRQTRDDVRRTAQPTQMAEKSLFELSQSELGKLSFMFMSEARKDWAGVQESTRLAWKENGVKGLLTSAQFRRTATTIWLTTGLFSTVISRMLSDALDDGSDDEIFDDKNWNPYAVTASVMLGPLGGMPMVGNIAGGFDRSTMSKVFQGADGLKQIGKALWKQEIPKNDRVGWVERQSKKVLDGVGMFSKSAATVSAVGNAIDQAFRSVHKAK